MMGGCGSAQAGDSADATRVVPNPGYVDPAATQPSAEPTRVMGYGDTAQDLSLIYIFAPSLDVCAIVGTKAQRRVQIAGVAKHNVVVTSYDLMRRDIDEYLSLIHI